MWGTSFPGDNPTGDFGNEPDATSISDPGLFRLLANVSEQGATAQTFLVGGLAYCRPLGARRSGRKGGVLIADESQQCRRFVRHQKTWNLFHILG
jgi:hypothetical protein